MPNPDSESPGTETAPGAEPSVDAANSRLAPLRRSVPSLRAGFTLTLQSAAPSVVQETRAPD